jgi:hypothetical protein
VKVPVKLGLLCDPVNEDSARLLRLDDGGGGGAEWEPVGLVKDSVGLVNEAVGTEWE